MRYFSEETVMDILDKIERDNGHSVTLSFPNFSELKSINLPDKHGRFIDVDDAIRILRKWGDAPIKRNNFEIADLLESLAEIDTVLEASNGFDN